MEENQEKYLEEAKKVVREQAYFMKKALESANLRDALRYASTMLGELRTSLLSPKTYYILFMQIFDELRVLEAYFKEEYRRGRRMIDLYESVQHAHNIVPRLYLLITVGSVYIQTHDVPARQILSDLLEMIKGVQHPLRGLFLRYYFLKMCKDKLPDRGNEYEGDGGTIEDSITCILNNLSEMNKLWIRMQGNKEKSKREKERVDLKVTVGENLHRLSSLDGVHLDMYKETVLPRILELIIQSKDTISQQYLIDCIIQAFPDEYHLNTLPTLLQTFTTGLQPNVDIKTIFIRLMDRLADFALDADKTIHDFDINIFEMFKGSIDKIIDDNTVMMELKKFLDLEVAFLKFSLRCYPSNSNYVNQILKSCVCICEKQPTKDFDPDSQKNIVTFLTMPLETMSLTILQMNEYPNLMKYLPFPRRRQVATKICQAVTHLKQPLADPVVTQQLLTFISPLLKTEKDYQDIEPYEFEEEQQLVARLVHLVTGQSLGRLFNILELFREKFLEGEIRRMKFTLPSLIFAYISFVRSLNSSKDDSVPINNILKIIRSLIDKITSSYPDIALRLYLNLLLCINEFDHGKEFDEFSYDIATAGMQIYEEELGDSESKLRALQVIVPSLQRLSCLSEENYDTLVTNATQYCSKLLKKNEQCLAVLQCTHLFHTENYRNDQRVFECFKKCIRLAKTCLEAKTENLILYISILNKFFFFLNLNVETLKPGDVQEIIDIIVAKLPEVNKENPENIQQIKQYWRTTVTYINERKSAGDGHYANISV